MSPASRVANHGSVVWLRTGVSSGNRPVLKKENRKCRACLEDPPWFVCLGVCLSVRMGKSRCRRGCPGDKIKSRIVGSAVCLSLTFVVVYIFDLCFLLCTVC